MNDVSDVICTLLLCKYPSIDAVYEYTVPCLVCLKKYVNDVSKLASPASPPSVRLEATSWGRSKGVKRGNQPLIL